jgi:hypothetical protein
MPRQPRIPAYRLHKRSGFAVVTLPDGPGKRRHVQLGRHGTPESRAEYDRVIAEWAANGRRLTPEPTAASPAGPTVNDVLLAFDDHAQRRYPREGRELGQYRAALRTVRELYGRSPAAEFGPRRLKTVRERMVAIGWSRNVVNRHVGRVKAAFRWAESEEMVPPGTSHALATVAGLPRNDPSVRQTAPPAPAEFDAVLPALPFMTPTVRAMVELQWLRPMLKHADAAAADVCRKRLRVVLIEWP